MPKNPIVPQPNGNLPKPSALNAPDNPPTPADNPPASSDNVPVIATPSDPVDAALAQTTPSDLPVITLERVEEWHLTVKAPSPIAWAAFCEDHDVTPLFIELGLNRMFDLQLMCEIEDKATFDAFTAALATRPEFTVLRIKHEVHALRDGEVPLYYEAHVKFDGPYRPDIKGSSRDLYRLSPQRWYATRRALAIVHLVKDHDGNVTGKTLVAPFNMAYVTEQFGNLASPTLAIAGTDFEWVLVDTNPSLDAGWL